MHFICIFLITVTVVFTFSHNCFLTFYQSNKKKAASQATQGVKKTSENNIDDVRTDLALMVSGEKVPAKIREYAATSMNLSTRDEIFSAMVVYGFLSYADGQICIPNKELMDILAVI